MPSTKALAALALTKTCKEISRESLPVFFGASTFTIFAALTSAVDHGLKIEAFRPNDRPIAKWLRQIGPMAHHLKAIELHLGGWNPNPNWNPIPSALSNAAVRYINVFGVKRSSFTLVLESSCLSCKEDDDYQYAIFKLPLNDLGKARTDTQA